MKERKVHKIRLMGVNNVASALQLSEDQLRQKK